MAVFWSVPWHRQSNSRFHYCFRHISCKSVGAQSDFANNATVPRDRARSKNGGLCQAGLGDWNLVANGEFYFFWLGDICLDLNGCTTCQTQYFLLTESRELQKGGTKMKSSQGVEMSSSFTIQTTKLFAVDLPTQVTKSASRDGV